MNNLPVEAVETHGVRLRTAHKSDLDEIVAACNDDATRENLDRLPVPYTRSHALEWITTYAPATRAEGGASFVIADPRTDHLIGAIGLHRERWWDARFNVGYWVAPWARRRGVATNATRALAEWAFRHQAARIELTHRLTNEASMRIAIAAGFTHEGIRRAGAPARDGRRLDVAVWSRLLTDSGEPTRRDLPDLGHLTDGVVTLTPLTADDTDDYYALAQLPEVIATTVAATPLSRERIARRCTEAPYNWLLGRDAQFVIRDAATGEFAGLISVMNEVVTKQAMLGYDVSPKFRGRGFAPRAVRLLTGWAFDVVGIERLVAGTAPDNHASQRVLEKAGFAREGYERARLPSSVGGPRVDNVSWALLPSDR